MSLPILWSVCMYVPCKSGPGRDAPAFTGPACPASARLCIQTADNITRNTLYVMSRCKCMYICIYRCQMRKSSCCRCPSRSHPTPSIHHRDTLATCVCCGAKRVAAKAWQIARYVPNAPHAGGTSYAPLPGNDVVRKHPKNPPSYPSQSFLSHVASVAP